MTFRRFLRAPAGVVSTLQLANGTNVYPDGSGFVRVPAERGRRPARWPGQHAGAESARPALVTNRAGLPYNSQSSGSFQAVTYRTRHVTLKGSRVSALRLVFSGTELTASGEFDAPVTLTSLKATVEVNGVFYKVYFNGQRNAVIEPGSFVISDPVGVSLAPGTEIFVRTRPAVGTLGEKWPLVTALDTTYGEFYTSGDNTDSGSMGANAAAGYGPCAILGTVSGPHPSVVIFGSSTGAGQGDTASTNERDLGYLSRLFSNNTGYCRMVRATQTAVMFLADYRRRVALLAAINPTHAVFQLGTNDIGNSNSFDTVQSTLPQVLGRPRRHGHPGDRDDLLAAPNHVHGTEGAPPHDGEPDAGRQQRRAHPRQQLDQVPSGAPERLPGVRRSGRNEPRQRDLEGRRHRQQVDHRRTPLHAVRPRVCGRRPRARAGAVYPLRNDSHEPSRRKDRPDRSRLYPERDRWRPHRRVGSIRTTGLVRLSRWRRKRRRT